MARNFEPENGRWRECNFRFRDDLEKTARGMEFARQRTLGEKVAKFIFKTAVIIGIPVAGTIGYFYANPSHWEAVKNYISSQWQDESQRLKQRYGSYEEEAEENPVDEVYHYGGNDIEEFERRKNKYKVEQKPKTQHEMPKLPKLPIFP